MNRVVDSICHRGCGYVNSILADVDERQRCEELQALDTEQQVGVLKELQTVMAVYDKSGNCKL